MAFKKNPGRQEVIAARVDIDFTDIDTAGEFEVMNLPDGAVIVGGYFYDNTTGLTGVAISVEDASGTELIANMAGIFSNGRVDITPTGDVITVPGFVKIDTTGNASAGDAYLYIEYVVKGRAAFSEG